MKAAKNKSDAINIKLIHMWARDAANIVPSHANLIMNNNNDKKMLLRKYFKWTSLACGVYQLVDVTGPEILMNLREWADGQSSERPLNMMSVKLWLIRYN